MELVESASADALERAFAAVRGGAGHAALLHGLSGVREFASRGGVVLVPRLASREEGDQQVAAAHAPDLSLHDRHGIPSATRSPVVPRRAPAARRRQVGSALADATLAAALFDPGVR